MAAVSIWMELLSSVVLPIEDNLLAAIAAGALLGGGVGTALRSFGSTGGLDIIAVILHQRFGFRIGQIGFLFNMCVFGVGFWLMDTDVVMYSLISVFVSGQVTDHVLSMFNQRKLVFIISNQAQAISRAIIEGAQRGVTILEGRGGYTDQPKQVVMTVVNNLQQKKLEEMIFTLNPDAFRSEEHTSELQSQY